MVEQFEPKSKQELLESVEIERRALDNVLGTLAEARLLLPGMEGNRNGKDIIAHITEWEKRMVKWVNESYSGIVPQRPAPGVPWDDLDGLNEQIYLANKDKSLAEVLSSSSDSYKHALDLIQSMTEQDLFDGSRFAWRNGDPMWHLVAANTCWHYKEHREQIEAWIKRNP